MSSSAFVQGAPLAARKVGLSPDCRLPRENRHLALAALAQGESFRGDSLLAPLFITDKSSGEKMRNMTQLAPRKRRRRTRAVPYASKNSKLIPVDVRRSSVAGRAASGGYEQRKWSRPHPIELLARDIDTARVRDV